MTRSNLHATALVVNQAGLLITGPSGAGKSRLALTLIETCRARNGFATLVADDQVWLCVRHDRLVAEAPESIAGLVEIRGYGPAVRAYERCAVIDRLVTLVEKQEAPRLREESAETLMGVSLPHLALCGDDTMMATRAVLAWLDTV